MPHGGIIYFNSPVECFLNIKTPLPPKAAHIPMSRLFFRYQKSSNIGYCSKFPAYAAFFDKSPDMIYKNS